MLHMIDPTTEDIIIDWFSSFKRVCEFNPSGYIKVVFEFSRRFAL